MPLVDPVYTGMPLDDPANTCRVHWKKHSWNCPTLDRPMMHAACCKVSLISNWHGVSTSTLLSACFWYSKRHYSFCVFGSKDQTTLTILVACISGCMLRSDRTCWPPNQMLSVHWDATGQTRLEWHWLMLSSSCLLTQSRAHLHNWNTLEDQWSHKYNGIPLKPHWLMLARRSLEDHWGHTGNIGY